MSTTFLLRFPISYLYALPFSLTLSRSHDYHHRWAMRGNPCTYMTFTYPYVLLLLVLSSHFVLVYKPSAILFCTSR